jgi:hypothetical protein
MDRYREIPFARNGQTDREKVKDKLTKREKKIHRGDLIRKE